MRRPHPSFKHIKQTLLQPLLGISHLTKCISLFYESIYTQSVLNPEPTVDSWPNLNIQPSLQSESKILDHQWFSVYWTLEIKFNHLNIWNVYFRTIFWNTSFRLEHWRFNSIWSGQVCSLLFANSRQFVNQHKTLFNLQLIASSFSKLLFGRGSWFNNGNKMIKN